MKINYFKSLTVLLLSSILVVSCQNDVDSTIDPTNNPVISTSIPVNENDPFVIKLIEMGYDLKRIEEYKDYYLVEGDIIFNKNYAFNKSNKNITGKTKQYYTNSLVDINRVNNITVRMDSSMPISGVDNWTTAINSAITHWNDIPGSRINFIFTTNTTADITITSDNATLPDNTIAAANFPTNNSAWSQIMVNLDYNSNVSVPESGKIYNIIHELGHCIGFRHTNWVARNESSGTVGANNIPNTSVDNVSVMNGGTADYLYTGFSTWDNYSARYLYPDHNSDLFILTPYDGESVMTGQSSFYIYWKSNLINEANIKIEIFADGVLYTTFTTPNNGFTDQAYSPNSYTKIKISSISNPNIYDEISFYHSID